MCINSLLKTVMAFTYGHQLKQDLILCPYSAIIMRFYQYLWACSNVHVCSNAGRFLFFLLHFVECCYHGLFFHSVQFQFLHLRLSVLSIFIQFPKKDVQLGIFLPESTFSIFNENFSLHIIYCSSWKLVSQIKSLDDILTQRFVNLGNKDFFVSKQKPCSIISILLQVAIG